MCLVQSIFHTQNSNFWKYKIKLTFVSKSDKNASNCILYAGVQLNTSITVLSAIYSYFI